MVSIIHGPGVNPETGGSAQRRCIGLQALRVSRFDLALAALAVVPVNPRQGSSDMEARPATRLRATSLHRVAEQAGGTAKGVHPGQDADLLKGADRLVHRAPGAVGGLGDRLV